MHRRGMSLVELLVVITILFTLVALLLPAVQRTRQVANDLRCANNLKQVGIGLLNQRDANNTYPPAAVGSADGWAIATLPYLEQSATANALSFRSDVPSTSAANAHAASQLPTVYRCPGRGETAPSFIPNIPATHYAINEALADQPLDPNRPTHRTPLIGHIDPAIAVPWVNNPVLAADEFGCLHFGMVPGHRLLVLFEDGHVGGVETPVHEAMPQ